MVLSLLLLLCAVTLAQRPSRNDLRFNVQHRWIELSFLRVYIILPKFYTSYIHAVHPYHTPPIPQSALKVIQKFLIQKLFVINFEDISNNFQITSQRETSKVIQNSFKSTSKVF